MSPLLAYFDPGAGSLLIQALLGGTAGLIVFGKYLWDSASSAILHDTARRQSRPNLIASISADSSGEIPQGLLP
jgi:hypothetical protein